MKIYLIDTRLDGIKLTPDTIPTFKRGGMILGETDSENSIPVNFGSGEAQ